MLTTGARSGLYINAAPEIDVTVLARLRHSEMGLLCLWHRRTEVLTTVLSLVRTSTRTADSVVDVELIGE